MSNHVVIKDLAAKITLLLRSGRSMIHTNAHLEKALNISPDYLSRLKNGSRALTEEKFEQVCELFGLAQREWFAELDIFGNHLGFSRKEIASITTRPLPGIDFSLRLKDTNQINRIFNLISGYWESFSFSVSRSDTQQVSRDLVAIRNVDQDGFFECDINDGTYKYSGWCFPLQRHLYFIMEQVELSPEIIFYLTNIPTRPPLRLYGMMLSLSGAVNQTTTYPAAAKIVFRSIGKAEDVKEKFNLNAAEDVEAYLNANIPGFVDPDKPQDADMKKIFADIANTVPPDAVPFALRMTI